MQRQSTGNLNYGDKDHDLHGRFCLRGGLPRLDNPVWSGALAFGGGLAFGCTVRDPPHSHGVSNRENEGAARGKDVSPALAIFGFFRQSLRTWFADMEGGTKF